MRPEDYIRYSRMPQSWCPGCGNGTVMGMLVRALAELELPLEKVVLVTGPGCSGTMSTFMTPNCFHVTHGRELAFATGIKLANPELTVIAVMGDGACANIGGCHFINTARRNVNVTAIMVNNLNYGMTGGQYSATTPTGMKTVTSCYGNVEGEFDACKVAEAAGAQYVARGTVDNPHAGQRLIRDAIRKKGFAFVDILSGCPTHYGRNNSMRRPADVVKYLRERSIPVAKAMKDPSAAEGKLLLGKLYEGDLPDYGTRYDAIIHRLQEKGGV